MRTLLLSVLVLLAAALPGQTAPVQASVQLIQPSVFPEDLAQPSAMLVTLTLLDNRQSLDVLPVFVLTDGAGRVYRSTPDINNPLRLNGLQSVTLVGRQLLPFLQRIGADAGAGLGGEGLVLAEGPLQVCVELYSALVPDVLISNTVGNCSVGFAGLEQPPTPLTPSGEVIPIDPLLDAVNFTWAPNYFATPVINYLHVWEVPVGWEYMSPDIIISSQPRIRPRVRVDVPGAASFLWQTVQADLLPGRRYLYQIEVTDPTGRVRFANNGFSRPEYFDYLLLDDSDELCLDPADFAIAGDLGSQSLTWTGPDLPNVDYQITARRQLSGALAFTSRLNGSATNPPRAVNAAGGAVTYSYALSDGLDITGGRGYTIELCAICSNTGERNCAEIDYGVDTDDSGDDGEPGEGDCPEGEPSLRIVERFATAANLEVNWPGYEGGFTINYRRQRLVDGMDLGGDVLDLDAAADAQEEDGSPTTAAPATSPPDFTATAGRATYTITDLRRSADYLGEVCAPCPDGERCWEIQWRTRGYRCLDEAELAAAFSIVPNDASSFSVVKRDDLLNANPDGFTARLLLADSDMAVPGVAATGQLTGVGGLRYNGLTAGEAYVVELCHDCGNGTTTCSRLAATAFTCDTYRPELRVSQAGFDRLNLRWNPSGGAETMAYRRADSGGPNDDFFAVADGQHVLSAMMPLTSYEVIVCGECDGAAICDTISATTRNVGCSDAGQYSYDYSCDNDEATELPEMGHRVASLTVGDSIWASDYLVEVNSVEVLGDDKYGGRGTAMVPYLRGAKLEVVFEQIEVNRNCRLVAGEMIVQSPLAPLLEQIADLLAEVDVILGQIDAVLGVVSQVLGVVQDALILLADHLEEQDALNEVLDATREAIEQIPFIPQTLLDDLADAEQCLRRAARNDNQTEYETCLEQYNDVLDRIKEFEQKLFDAPFQVNFTPAGSQSTTYGWDSIRYESITQHYVSHEIAGSTYEVPWASTRLDGGAPGNQFTAYRPDGQSLSGIVFIDKNGNEVPNWSIGGGSPDTYTSSLEAWGDEQVTHLYAAIPRQNPAEGDPPYSIAGQVSVISFDQEEVNLHFIPVNLPDLSLDDAELSTLINDIYRSAVTRVNVTVEDNLTVDGFEGTLEQMDASALSNYTPEMLELRRAARRAGYRARANSKDYYLLLVDNLEPAFRVGYMPRKRHYGFLSASQLGQTRDLARVAAHELAHGAFHLQHPAEQFGVASGGRDNLLDDDGGDELVRYQWGEVHAPVGNFTLFDDGEEGESVTVNGANLITNFRQFAEDGYVAFLNAVNQPVYLPLDQLVAARFATGGEKWKNSQEYIPTGSLIMYSIKGSSPNEELVYTTGANGSFYRSASCDAIAACTTYAFDRQLPGDVHTISAAASPAPVVIRVAKRNDQYVVHYNTVESLLSLNSFSYDSYLLYFFEQIGANYIARGGVFDVDSEGVVLSNDYAYPVYKKFAETYEDDLQYSELSSFYIGGLSRAFADNSALLSQCPDISIAPAEVMKLTNQILLSNRPTVNYLYNGTFGSAFTLRPNTDDILIRALQEQVLPIHSDRTTISATELAQRYDMIRFFNDRQALVDGYQTIIDGLLTSDDAVAEFIKLAFSSQHKLHECEFNLLSIPLATRQKLIKGILSYDEGLEVFVLYSERSVKSAFLTLLESTPDAEVPAVLDFLTNESVPRTEVQFSQSSGGTYLRGFSGGTQVGLVNVKLWQAMVQRIDDGFFDTHGKRLVEVISELCRKAYDNPSSGTYFTYASALKYALQNSIQGDNLSLPDSDYLLYRTIPYHHKRILARMAIWLAAHYPANRGIGPYGPIYTSSISYSRPLDFRYVETTASIENDLINIEYDIEGTVPNLPEVVDGFLPVDRIGLHPFEPVFIDDASTFRTARNFVKGSVSVRPALVYLYLEETAREQTVMDVAGLVGDAVTLIAPGGAILKLGQIGKTLYYMDKASSVLGLAGAGIDATDVDPDSALGKVVTGVHISSAVLGLGSMSGEAIINLPKTQDNIANFLRRTISVTGANANEAIQANRLEAAINNIMNLEDDAVDIIHNNPSLRSFHSKIIMEGLADLTDAPTGLRQRGGNAIGLINQPSTSAVRIVRSLVNDFNFSADVRRGLEGLSAADVAALQTRLENFTNPSTELADVVATFNRIGERAPHGWSVLQSLPSRIQFNENNLRRISQDAEEMPFLRVFFEKEGEEAFDSWDLLDNVYPNARFSKPCSVN